MNQDYNRNPNKKTLPSMIKSLKRLGKKGTTGKVYCQNSGCNNVINDDGGVSYNYCSDSCQLASTNPFDDNNNNYEEENSWSSRSNQDETNVYTDFYSSSSSRRNNNSYTTTSSSHTRNVQTTSEWKSQSRQEQSPEDYPIWYNSSLDMKWRPQETNNAYSSSEKTSKVKEIECPACTYYVHPNRTTCEMCGTVVKKEDDNKRRINSENNYLDDDLYVNSYSPKSNGTRKERAKYENEYLDDLYVSSPRSTKLNDDNTRNERIEYEDDDLYVSSPRSTKLNDNRRRKDRIEYEDEYDYSDDLYVGSPKLKKLTKLSGHSENENENEYDYTDDLYVGSPKLTKLNNKTREKDRIEYEDESDYDDLYVGSPKPTKSDNARKKENKRFDYEDDLYIGAPKSNVFSTTKSRRQQLPTPPLQTTDDADQIPCQYCLYMNHPLMVNCERCDQRLNREDPEESMQNDLLILQLEAEQYEQMSNEFKVRCPKCSFLNAGYAAQCEMCYLPINDGPLAAEEDTNKVQCPNCTFVNDSSVITCEICNEELPGAAELKKAYEEFYNNTHTRMTPMNPNEPDYINVQQRFLAGIPNAKIQVILRMNMPRRIVDAHENYKNRAGQPVHQMFHGTSVACNPERYYNNTAGMNFCTANCGLCGISQHGNLRRNSKHGGRMWFARNSTVSLGFCGAVPIKAMFSVDVINPVAQDIIIVADEAATLIRFLILYKV